MNYDICSTYTVESHLESFNDACELLIFSRHLIQSLDSILELSHVVRIQLEIGSYRFHDVTNPWPQIPARVSVIFNRSLIPINNCKQQVFK